MNGRTAVGITLGTRAAVIWMLTCGASVTWFLAYLFSTTASTDWWLPGAVVAALIVVGGAQVWLAWRMLR